MNWIVWLQIAVNFSLSLGLYLVVRDNRQLRNEWQEHKKVRTKLYEELADPDKIVDEMEAGARRREMYDAQRSTLPRQPAGEPAVVYRPKMRGAPAGKFRIQKSRNTPR